MRVLYSDNDIAVIVKPVGLLSQADANGGESAVSLLSEMFACEIYPLHRLDKQVSGVMVYAKNKAAAAKLSADIAEHRFVKEYLAVVHGTPDGRGEMCDLLFKDSRKGKSYVVKRMRKGVKEAFLEYECLKTDNELSLVKVLLHTGRTHQIRVHSAYIGLAVAGDAVYGPKKVITELSGQCLHAKKIGFIHPKTKEYMEFDSDLPEYFTVFLNKIKPKGLVLRSK